MASDSPSESLKLVESKFSADEVRAYKANFEAYKPGIQKHEVAEYYTKWAESGGYDTQITPNNYSGPEKTAEYMATHYTDEEKATIRILDVAAGTGKLGVQLHKQGFRNMDALDPAEGMLAKAKEKRVYTNFIQDFIGLERPVPVENGAYDLLTACGGFGEGHIPPSALHEMIRVVRPGGLISISLREEYLEYVEEYKGVLTPLMKKLEKEGKWRFISKEPIENFSFCLPGVMFLYEVL